MSTAALPLPLLLPVVVGAALGTLFGGMIDLVKKLSPDNFVDDAVEQKALVPTDGLLMWKKLSADDLFGGSDVKKSN